MTKPSFIIFVLLFNVACKQNDKQTEGDLGIPSDSTALYFPVKTNSRFKFDKSELALDTLLNHRFSRVLFLFKEPILSTYVGNQEIYRFIYLRSFDNPIVVRIQKGADYISIISKSMEIRSNGYGNIKGNETKKLTENSWNRFLSKLKKANYWDLDPLTNPKSWNTDGALWILEGYKNGKYRFIVRQSFSNDNEFEKACLLLLKLSTIEIKEEDMY